MSDHAMRRLATRYAGGVSGTLTLSLTAAAAGVALLGVSGWFLTGAALTMAALGFNLFGPSALVRGLSFLRIGTRYGEKLTGHALTLQVLADLRESLFRRLTPRVPLQGIGLRHGDLVSRLVSDVEALDGVILTALGPLVTVLAVGLGLSLILFWLLPAAAPVFAADYAVAALLVPAALVLITRRSGRARVETQARLRMAVLEGIEGHADLRLFDRGTEACDHVAAAAARGAALARQQGRWTAGASSMVVLVGGLTILAVFMQGIEAVHRQAIGGPALVGLLLAVLASFEPVGLMTRSIGKFGVALAAGGRLRDLTQAVPAVIDPPDPARLLPGADLVLDDVTFAYCSERLVLDRVSLACEPGSRTAIIGESGCGKSTLLDLVLRLADPDGGTIRIAGTDVARISQAELYARVALMGQATPVFLGTIRENLRLGRPDASDVELWDALARARLDDTVRHLPQGLDTWCGEGGRTLSAGQARRLCLARTLLTRAAILLLDEPTSGLDRETEQAFFQDIGRATEGRTVLLVTHAALPPGTVDRIVRLIRGRLAF